MSSEKSGAPPPAGFVTEQSSSSSHTYQNAPSAPPVHGSPPASVYPNANAPEESAPYPEAPPSYQNAMSYPAAAPYGQPSMNAAYPPKPAHNQGYPTQPAPSYGYPPHPVINVNNTLPPPPARHPTPAIVVHIGGHGACRHCNLGVYQKRNDVCCLVCLIVLTVCTFPFGLVFLCCMPCAVTMRCSNCGRSP